MPIPIRISLEKDGTGCVLGCVGGNGERGGQVGEVENRFREEEAFEGVKGRLTRRGPVPGEVLLGEVKERAGDVGVVRNETSVEIGKSKERANIFHLGRGGPTCDSVEFHWVHG